MDSNEQLTLFNGDIARTKTFDHTFGWAIDQLKAGRTVCRRLWSADGVHIKLSNQELFRTFSLAPFFIIVYHPEMQSVWHPTINDILADDYDYA